MAESLTLLTAPSRLSGSDTNSGVETMKILKRCALWDSSYKPDIQEMSTLSIIKVSSSDTNQTLNKALRLLWILHPLVLRTKNISPSVHVTGLNEIKVGFQWIKDILLPTNLRVVVSSCDFEFEYANILYNVALSISKVCAGIARKISFATTDYTNKIKKCIMMLCFVIIILDELLSTVKRKPLYTQIQELEPSNLNILTLLMKTQIYELFAVLISAPYGVTGIKLPRPKIDDFLVIINSEALRIYTSMFKYSREHLVKALCNSGVAICLQKIERLQAHKVNELGSSLKSSETVIGFSRDKALASRTFTITKEEISALNSSEIPVSDKSASLPRYNAIVSKEEISCARHTNLMSDLVVATKLRVERWKVKDSGLAISEELNKSLNDLWKDPNSVNKPTRRTLSHLCDTESKANEDLVEEPLSLCVRDIVALLFDGISDKKKEIITFSIISTAGDNIVETKQKKERVFLDVLKEATSMFCGNYKLTPHFNGFLGPISEVARESYLNAVISSTVVSLSSIKAALTFGSTIQMGKKLIKTGFKDRIMDISHTKAPNITSKNILKMWIEMCLFSLFISVAEVEYFIDCLSKGAQKINYISSLLEEGLNDISLNKKLTMNSSENISGHKYCMKMYKGLESQTGKINDILKTVVSEMEKLKESILKDVQRVVTPSVVKCLKNILKNHKLLNSLKSEKMLNNIKNLNMTLKQLQSEFNQCKNICDNVFDGNAQGLFPVNSSTAPPALTFRLRTSSSNLEMNIRQNISSYEHSIQDIKKFILDKETVSLFMKSESLLEVSEKVNNICATYLPAVNKNRNIAYNALSEAGSHLIVLRNFSCEVFEINL